MNFKRLSALSLFAVLTTFAFTMPVAAQRPDGDLSNKNWRVFNINPDVPKLWDINQAQSLSTGGVGFTFNKTSSGWFTVYLNTNFIDLTGKTSIIAKSSWTASTLYVNRAQSEESGALFRLYFQSAQGNYNANDYWWSSDSCNLNDPLAALSCELNVPLNDRSHWTNLCGQSANDVTVRSGSDCVGGTYPGVSGYDGFTNAMRNVKDVGLSFGRPSRFASGVAFAGTGSASFHLNSFSVF